MTAKESYEETLKRIDDAAWKSIKMAIIDGLYEASSVRLYPSLVLELKKLGYKVEPILNAQLYGPTGIIGSYSKNLFNIQWNLERNEND